MKKIILFFGLFILAQLDCFSQTYIAPVVGYDFIQMETSDSVSSYFRILDKGYAVKSPTLGLKIEQQFSSTFGISYYFSYTHKTVNTHTGDYFNYYLFDTDFFRNSLSLKYYIKKYFYTSVGANCNIMTNIGATRYGRDGAVKATGGPSLKDWGINFLTGIDYKNFEFEFYYSKGLAVNKPTDPNTSVQFKPTNAFGITLSYKIQLLKGCASKKDKKIISPLASID